MRTKQELSNLFHLNDNTAKAWPAKPMIAQAGFAQATQVKGLLVNYEVPDAQVSPQDYPIGHIRLQMQPNEQGQ